MATKTNSSETTVQAAVAPQGEQEHQPLLALRTFVPERPAVDINGTIYEMRLLSEFGAVRRQRVINTWSRAMAIMDRAQQDDADISPEEERLVDDAYVRVIAAAIPEMPRDVILALNTMQREQLVGHFFRITSEGRDPVVEELAAADSSTGAS